MADATYTVSLLRRYEHIDVHEVRLADGTSYQFACSPSRKGEGWDEEVAIAVRKAQRNSEYLKAHA